MFKKILTTIILSALFFSCDIKRPNIILIIADDMSTLENAQTPRIDEIASKGSLGIELELNKVPCREENMTPYEMMLSESQERMLIILEDGKEEYARKIFAKWDLDFVVIGKTTNTKNLTLKYDDKVVGNIPIDALASKAPIY